jgi:hypothetical protein
LWPQLVIYHLFCVALKATLYLNALKVKEPEAVEEFVVE